MVFSERERDGLVIADAIADATRADAIAPPRKKKTTPRQAAGVSFFHSLSLSLHRRKFIEDSRFIAPSCSSAIIELNLILLLIESIRLHLTQWKSVNKIRNIFDNNLKPDPLLKYTSKPKKWRTKSKSIHSFDLTQRALLGVANKWLERQLDGRLVDRQVPRKKNQPIKR